MTTKITTRNSNGKRTVWSVPGQQGEGNALLESASQENPSKHVLGIVSLEGQAEKIIECQLYQRGRCHYGDQCKYAHVPPAGSPQTAAPVSNKNGKETRGTVAKDTSTSIADNSRERTRGTENSHNYPIRNGAADCQYYLKTGKCNYGSRCKFNHPFRDENLVNALNRRDCFDFVQRGTCPYGRSCKYNHPTSSESIFNGYENQSSSSADNNSSLRTVSRSRHRRSASEPRCPSRRETAQEPVTVSQERQLPSQSYSNRAQAVQEFSKWDKSLDPKYLSSEKKHCDPRSQRSINLVVPVETAGGNMLTVNDILNQDENSMRVSERPIPRSGHIDHRLGGVVQNGSENPGVDAHINSALMNANPDLRRQHVAMGNGRIPSSKDLPSGDLLSTNGWFQNTATTTGTQLRELRAVESNGSLTHRAESHVTNGSEVQRLQAGSIWRSDFPMERKENMGNLATASLDFGRLSTQVDPPTVPASLQATQLRLQLEGHVWGCVKAGHRRAHSLSSSTLPFGFPSVSSGYSFGTSSFGDEFLRNEAVKNDGVQSAWGVGESSARASLEAGMRTAEMERLRREQQIQAYQQHHQQFAQIQTQEEKILRQMQQIGRYPGPGGISMDYAGHLGIKDDGAEDKMCLNGVAHDGSSLEQLQTSRDEMARKVSSDSWNSKSFDPMRYKASLFGGKGLGQKRPTMTENVWKPIEKSSIFGPGLFGMEHL